MRVTGVRPTSLTSIRARLADGGRKVVLGTGCFDIMHSGHLYFLEQASEQGDVLVIGVNSDRSVREIKGPDRPIVGELARATLVAGLRCVDYVFVYDDIVADDQIRELRPDVFVTGAASIDGYPSESGAAREIGARVHVIDRLPDLSTSLVVGKVLRRGGSGQAAR